MNNAIYTVSQLNLETKQLLSQYFLSIKIEGEISNISTPASGHIYFTLKDATAQIRCAMFRTHQNKLSFKPENGNKIIAKVQVGLYEARGDYQLLIKQIEIAGNGTLLRAFEALKNKLSQQGLFELSHKKPIPILPATIGIITSPTGAVIHDILTILQRRFPASSVLIYPVAVQGKSATKEIIYALKTANTRKECVVLMLARGGGSPEDLHPFNDEALAYAIAASKLPIISAIGHETDFTIADFVADYRAPTPSAGAEFVVPDVKVCLHKLQQLQQRLQRQNIAQQNILSTQLKGLKLRLQQKDPHKDLQSKAQRLDELDLRLYHCVRTRIQNSHAIILMLTAKLAPHNLRNQLQLLNKQQQTALDRLLSSIKHTLTSKQQLLTTTKQTLNAVNPLATLSRGYALVTQTNDLNSFKPITSSHSLKVGETIKTKLAQGYIISNIEKLEDESNTIYSAVPKNADH